ncbi:hypothetical protein CW304_10690 [Bacillus sp. UFRGS-B20]|nr:hypothetical protein CW304_10690 [Bacillus sp. UFRGS-B20]
MGACGTEMKRASLQRYDCVLAKRIAAYRTPMLLSSGNTDAFVDANNKDALYMHINKLPNFIRTS